MYIRTNQYTLRPATYRSPTDAVDNSDDLSNAAKRYAFFTSFKRGPRCTADLRDNVIMHTRTYSNATSFRTMTYNMYYPDIVSSLIESQLPEDLLDLIEDVINWGADKAISKVSNLSFT